LPALFHNSRCTEYFLPFPPH